MIINKTYSRQLRLYRELAQFYDRHPALVWGITLYNAFLVLWIGLNI